MNRVTSLIASMRRSKEVYVRHINININVTTESTARSCDGLSRCRQSVVRFESGKHRIRRRKSSVLQSPVAKFDFLAYVRVYTHTYLCTSLDADRFFGNIPEMRSTKTHRTTSTAAEVGRRLYSANRKTQLHKHTR